MTKSSVARTPAATKAPRAIPLKDVTITWRRRRHFLGEPEEGKDISITGEQLAVVLATLAHQRSLLPNVQRLTSLLCGRVRSDDVLTAATVTIGKPAARKAVA